MELGYITTLCKNAKGAVSSISNCSIRTRNNIISDIAASLLSNSDYIVKQNAIDICNAQKNDVPDHMIDRLMLNSSRVKDMMAAALKIATLPDVISRTLSGDTRPNGLNIKKVTVPLGLACIIYESRPNVTVDAAILCVKTCNAVILRGGKEAFNTNLALVNIMRECLVKNDIDPNAISFVEDTSREVATELMKQNEYIDVLIPRGGASLIKSVVSNATIPVIETGAGNCHIYVDNHADLDMANSIIFNAKTSRPSVCNACETVLVHSDTAKEFLPKLQANLNKKDVKLIGCERVISILGDSVFPASEEDYYTEYNDYILTIKVVSSLDEAIEHINKYSTKHSEAIITRDITSATRFTSRVTSAVVYVNASTRFTDGEEFGFGAEIGISTQKLHARGPMGLEALTTYKYIVMGDGQIR